jgi:putative nucleotidyltransferase with HDIG domain
MDGHDVGRALKEDETTRAIPVIFVTALNEPVDEAKGFETGAVDYLTKPVSAPVVQARVRTHLALQEAREQLQEWNANLKKRLLQSVAAIREKSQALMTLDEQSPRLRGYVHLVELLSGIFELMGGRHGVHARTVGELAGDAARKMGLDAETVAKIRLAGLLHDVGKLGTAGNAPENGTRELSAEERDEERLHTVRGQEMFSTLEELHDVGIMVRGPHEAYSGPGYPDGLEGDAIPLGARLVAIADFIELAANSVTNQRAEYALMSARHHGGTLLDPHLVPYFGSITRIVYFEGKKSGATMEANVAPLDLISGLVLSRDVVSTAGVLLLPKGTALDPAGITLIRRQSHMGTLPEPDVWVTVEQYPPRPRHGPHRPEYYPAIPHPAPRRGSLPCAGGPRPSIRLCPGPVVW